MSDSSREPVRRDASAEKRRLVVNTLANGLSQSATMVASLVFMPMLIGAFGIEKYGLYMLAASVTVYAALLDFGAGSALTKLVAEYRAKDDREALVELASSGLTFYTLIGCVVAAAMVGLGHFSQEIFAISVNDALLLRNMLWVGAVFQLWYWPTSTARHALAGLQRFDVLAWTGVLGVVLGIGATLWVLEAGAGPFMLMGLSGIAGAIVAAVNVIVARRVLGVPLLTYRRLSKLRLAAIFSFSWPVFVVQLSDALFYEQTDRIVLGVFAGAAAVGLYEAAAKFNALVVYLSSLSVSAVLPLASAYGAQGRHASLKSLLLRGTKYTALIIAPTALVLVVVADPLIAAWLGPNFDGQAPIAMLLIAPHVLVCLGVMGDAIVVSKGRLAARIPYIFAQAVLNIALSVLLVGRYGLIGVAIGTAVAHLVDFPLHIRFLMKETDTTLYEWMSFVVRPVYPGLIVPVALAVGLSFTVLSETVLGIAVIAGMSLLPFWGLVYAFGLARQEKDDLQAFFAGLRARLVGRMNAS